MLRGGTGAKRVAVVLVAHGEAETAGFIENYRVALHTLRRASGIIPVPPPLQYFISFSSSLKKRLAGRRSGSPQNPLTRAQAKGLQAYLDRYARAASPDLSFEVMASFSASEPYVEDSIEKTRTFDARILVPMAPIDNALSCGVLCDHLAGSCTPDELARTRVVGRLWRDAELHRACLDHLFGSAGNRVAAPDEKSVLMLLCHGTLVEDRYGEAPSFRTGYEESLEFSDRLASLIADDPRNRWGRVMTAFLNHDVGGRWSEPSFEEACRMIDGQGYRQVSLFAAGYFSDGNETIHRSGLLAASKPDIRVETIPCLNDAPAFISCLAGKVVAATRQILAFSGHSVSDTV